MNHKLNELVLVHVMGLPVPSRALLESLPDFSGDIYLAAKVIERMYILGWRVSLMNGYDGKWRASFLGGMGEAIELKVTEAICRAALRALEVPGV